MNNIEKLRDKILQLDNLIKTEHPAMPGMLRDIHNHLREDPELVTLATEEEIAIVVLGLRRHTNAVVTDAMIGNAKKQSTKKSLAKLTDEDLGLDEI